MMFSIKDSFSNKGNQIRWLQIREHWLKKSLMKDIMFYKFH